MEEMTKKQFLEKASQIVREFSDKYGKLGRDLEIADFEDFEEVLVVLETALEWSGEALESVEETDRLLKEIEEDLTSDMEHPEDFQESH